MAGTAPTAAPRPSERPDELPGEAADATVAVATERASEPAPPAAKAKPARARRKTTTADPDPDAGAAPAAEPDGRTEQLTLVPAEEAAGEPAKKTVEVTVGERAKPASKPRRKPARPSTEAAAEPPETVEDTGAAPGRAARFAAVVRRHAVPLLAVAAAVLTTVAVVAGIQDAQLRDTPAARNTALVDVGTTAEVASQLSDAIETVYSFDYTRLDENERAARELVTPAFADQFGRLFGEVRKLAPQQQAVVSATVTRTAVKEITGDRAVLLAFIDQRATRAAPDPQAEQVSARGRLVVTGERVDGRWKISAVTTL